MKKIIIPQVLFALFLCVNSMALPSNPEIITTWEDDKKTESYKRTNEKQVLSF